MCGILSQWDCKPQNKVVAVNAGHGTSGGSKVKTFCHPDKTAKVTGGTTGAGATKAVAVSGGMTFADGTAESTVTLRMAQIFRNKLLAAGYDVLMIRDGMMYSWTILQEVSSPTMQQTAILPFTGTPPPATKALFI